jgi:hypothetical protein
VKDTCLTPGDLRICGDSRYGYSDVFRGEKSAEGVVLEADPRKGRPELSRKRDLRMDLADEGVCSKPPYATRHVRWCERTGS